MTNPDGQQIFSFMGNTKTSLTVSHTHTHTHTHIHTLFNRSMIQKGSERERQRVG